MGLFIRQNENRSPFQEKLAEELRERTKLQASGAEPLDQSKGSNYLKDTEQTSGRVWVWVVVAAVVVGAIFIFVVPR